MKKVYMSMALMATLSVTAQQEEGNIPDTTRMNFGKIEMIIVEHSHGETSGTEDSLSTNEEEDDFSDDKPHYEAHWAGVNFGFNTLLNANQEASFPDYPYWQNDAARSQVWDLNLMEHKFPLIGEYFGLTTGLGFNFTSVAFKDNYILSYSSDTLAAFIDTVNTYSKNKLKASYLTVPLMLEFNTNEDEDRSFYLAAGVVGGVRIGSKIKREGEFEGKEFEQKLRGTYALNSFKLDAAVRLGYADWGVFANYSLLPLFETDKTTTVYPLTFGLSYNF